MTKKPIEFLFSLEALQDLEDIRFYTLENFGEKILNLYDELIFKSIHDLSLDTNRPGVTSIDEIAAGCRVYHIKYSKTRRKSRPRIKTPHHYILVQQNSIDRFEVLGIIHDK